MTFTRLLNLFLTKYPSGKITETQNTLTVQFAKRGKKYNYSMTYADLALKLDLPTVTVDELKAELINYLTLNDDIAKYNIDSLMNDFDKTVNETMNLTYADFYPVSLDFTEIEANEEDMTIIILFESGTRVKSYDRVGIECGYHPQTHVTNNFFYPEDSLI